MDALENGPLGGEALGGSGPTANGSAWGATRLDGGSPNPLTHPSGDSVRSDAQSPDPPRRAQVGSELNLIARAIEDLQGRLDEANARLGDVEYLEASELEIGRLLVEAQSASDAVLSHLEGKVHEVLVALELKARQVLAEATAEAHLIREEARTSASSATRIARDLRDAVADFTAANADFFKELGVLNTLLDLAAQIESTSEIDDHHANPAP